MFAWFLLGMFVGAVCAVGILLIYFESRDADQWGAEMAAMRRMNESVLYDQEAE